MPRGWLEDLVAQSELASAPAKHCHAALLCLFCERIPDYPRVYGRYCSPTCHQRAYRQRRSAQADDA